MYIRSTIHHGFFHKEIEMSGAFSGIALVLIVVIIVVGMFATTAAYNADKLRYGVPWLRWLTLDEIVEMGHSRFWANYLLPIFHRIQWVEIRVSDQLSPQDYEQAKRRGLLFSTAALYEYRFTERWKRRSKKILPKPRLPVFQPMPM